ncbi:S8 family serine peptidase [Photobacterium leiognathi]|uniref:S8 family serine peptidase n=1 Tax=Photobacterium leiognathi TaxID=553611 RepID=UPI002980D5AA|nr:S8 family serine peptidase [Photobacterium leiognathi]
MKKNITMNTLVLLSLLGCGSGDDDISTTKNNDDISVDTGDDSVSKNKNNKPELNGDTVYFYVGNNTLVHKLPIIDKDGDKVTYKVINLPQSGDFSVDDKNSEFTFTANLSSIKEEVVSLIASDGLDEIEFDITLQPELVLKPEEFQSSDNIIEGQFEFVSGADVEFTYNVISDENTPSFIPLISNINGAAMSDVNSFVINEDGSFKLTAQPYSDPIFIDVTLTSNDKTVTAQIKYLTEQKNINIDAFSDPLYFQQWHLNNTGQDAYSLSKASEGFDINIGQLHVQGITGKDIHVAIVDSGLEIAHEDLVENVIPDMSYDFVEQDDDPSPNQDETGGDHGTSVAGLTAAVGFNGKGGRGVAPSAGLSGFNYLKAQGMDVFYETHGGDKTQTADVINQSYGYGLPIILPTNAFNFEVQEVFIKNHYEVVNKPALMIKSAGNGFNRLFGDKRINSSEEETRLPAQIANSDPANASFYNTVVSALNANSDAPLSSYSTVGSSVLFAAPGGEYGVQYPAMITTDVAGCDRGYSAESEFGGYSGGLDDETQSESECSYTSIFNGTSSAAPVASGVAALIMQSNSDLTWRDVRYIMAKTATKIDLDFAPVILSQGGEQYIAEPGWITNEAGNSYHNWYGYGMINAVEAVQMATRNDELLPPLVESEFVTSNIVGSVNIPENLEGITQQIEITDDITIEAIQLKLDINHERMSDIAVEVISPSGTRSVVATPRHLHHWNPKDYFGYDAEVLFLSHAFLDEPAKGIWIVKVIDTNKNIMRLDYFGNESELANNTVLGSLAGASIKVYGHK